MSFEEEKMSLDKERFRFRIIRQGNNSFEEFVTSLKTQLEKCNYSDAESQLKDQIIEKCSNSQLRDLAFEREMSVDKLIETATLLEYIRSRATQRCKRCNEESHDHNSKNCKAWRSICGSCKRRGHLTECCFDIVKKRKFPSTVPQLPNAAMIPQCSKSGEDFSNVNRYKIPKLTDAAHQPQNTAQKNDQFASHELIEL